MRFERLDEARREAPRVVVLVDPVPGEVRDADGRDAGPPGRGDRQRRDVGDHEPGALAGQERRFARDPRVAVGIERLRGRERGRDVDVEAAALDGAGVHRARLEADGRADAAREEPRRDRRPHHDGHVGPPLGQGVDDGDLAHGVPEAVAGHVEDDRHQYSPGTMRQRTWRR